MSDVPISKLPIETLQQLEAQCADVVAEICRSLSYNADLVDAIRGLMHEKDTAAAIYALRESNPDLANRLVVAGLGVLINAVNLTSVQDELQRRIGELN
jgi:phosphoketolase